MLEQELQQLGGPGQEPEGDRAQLVVARVRVERREDLGDALHGRVDPDRIPGLDPRDDRTEAELVGAAEADVASGALGLGALVVEVGVGLDDLGLGDGEDPTARLVGDDPRDGRVDDPDPVEGQVTGQPRDAASDVDLGLAGAQHRPRPGESVLQVQHVGEGIARRGHPGAAGQCDLPEAEVLDAGRAVATGVDQHVAETSCMTTLRPLGRVCRVHCRPLRQDLEVADLGQSALPHRTTRRGQEGRCVEVGEGVDHAFYYR